MIAAAPLEKQRDANTSRSHTSYSLIFSGSAYGYLVKTFLVVNLHMLFSIPDSACRRSP